MDGALEATITDYLTLERERGKHSYRAAMQTTDNAQVWVSGGGILRVDVDEIAWEALGGLRWRQ